MASPVATRSPDSFAVSPRETDAERSRRIERGRNDRSIRITVAENGFVLTYLGSGKQCVFPADSLGLGELELLGDSQVATVADAIVDFVARLTGMGEEGTEDDNNAAAVGA